MLGELLGPGLCSTGLPEIQSSGCVLQLVCGSCGKGMGPGSLGNPLAVWK